MDAAGVDAGSLANPAYAAILERECSLLVPENQLKWQWISRSPDTFDFRAFDAIADYAERHHFKLRGHTLFWTPTKWYPKWLAEREFKSPAEAEQLLVNHVQTVCRRYGTRVYSYDVVNEAVAVRELLGLTGQFAAVDEILSGRENLLMFGRLFGLPRHEARRRAAALLERFDLADAADRPAKTYSGGMRRRLDLASSLLTRPRILFLDEPHDGARSSQS